MRRGLLGERGRELFEGLLYTDAGMRLGAKRWELLFVDDESIAPMPPPPAVWTAIKRRIAADTKVFALHRDVATHQSRSDKSERDG